VNQIRYPSQIDFFEYSRDNQNPRNFYGLPKEVVYCKKCVISNQRPNSAVEYEHSSMLKEFVMHVITLKKS
jgi:hypothetical protein